MYDYLIVGAGLYGAVFAHEAKKAGKKVLVIDRRPNIAGNVYTEPIEGIQVHKYGAHIFHTNNKEVWSYVNQFAEFNRFTNSPVANYHGELYSLPFNMYTFNKMWGVVTPQEAAAKIEEQRKAAGITEPKNLEEQAISLVGTDIYEKLIKGYTQKQWGRECKDLPSFIIKRLPVRLTFDNNYFNALYQGIPVGDRLYLKIIDYKTGKTKFDLTDIYYGLQLQLVVYMDAAMEKIGREYPDKTVVPAGLFYYHIEDPMVERKPVESEEETNADILKALRMNGLVNGDREALAHLDNRLGEEATADSDVVPVSIKNEAIVERRSQAAGEEKFRVLGAYVNRKMKHMGREILDGNIAASPYKNGQKTACDYCPYHSVCGFDLKTDGYQFRRFDKLSPEEIWGKMEEKDKKTER